MNKINQINVFLNTFPEKFRWTKIRWQYFRTKKIFFESYSDIQLTETILNGFMKLQRHLKQNLQILLKLANQNYTKKKFQKIPKFLFQVCYTEKLLGLINVAFIIYSTHLLSRIFEKNINSPLTNSHSSTHGFTLIPRNK